MKSLEGKIAIVTGAGFERGEVLVKLFADKGAKVVIADLNKGAVGRVVNEIIDCKKCEVLGDVVDVSEKRSQKSDG